METYMSMNLSPVDLIVPCELLATYLDSFTLLRVKSSCTFGR